MAKAISEATRQAILEDVVQTTLTHKAIADKHGVTDRFVRKVLADSKRDAGIARAAGSDNPLDDLIRGVLEMRLSQARVLSDEKLIEEMVRQGSCESLRSLSNDITHSAIKLAAFNAGIPNEIHSNALPAATGEYGEDLEAEIVDA